VAEYLQTRAKALNSGFLSDAAAKVAANPFVKVIEMIKSLLARLKEEAAAESEHKAYCDKELKANKLRRNEVTATVERLIAEVTQLGVEIQEHGERIATLSKEQANLAAAMASATDARQKEKAENEAAISDSQAAQQAVKQAVVVLKEFYSSQQPALLLQERRQVPEMAAYKGMQGANGGVIGMLEVILSDFARLELETKTSEEQAAEHYATFMDDSKAAAKEKHDLEFQLTLDKDQLEFEQGRVKDDLAGSQKELDSANAYYDSLKPMCLETHVSYEERVARRKEEIAALNEAYKVLDSHGM
jgi:hypothetical protein